MPKVKHISPVSSSALVSDATYGPSWNGVTDVAPSKNAVYDAINGIGYVMGNIAYVDPVGGNNATAMLGNILKPYQSIGAAITALGTLTNSAMVLRAGSYTISDFDCPYGLKAPGSFYKIVCDPYAVTINSYCSYGTWIFNGSSDTGGNGGVYGYPTIKNYSSVITGTVEGVSGYVFNVLPKAGFTTFQIDLLTNEDTGNLSCFRIGNGNTFIGTVQLFLQSRIYSRSLSAVPVLKAAPQSRLRIYGNGDTTIDNVAQAGMVNAYSIDVEDVTSLYTYGIRYSVRGQAFGANTDFCAKIQTGIQINDIQFVRSYFEFIEAKPTGKVIDFQNSLLANSQNVQFRDCIIKSRQSNAYVADGFSLSANNNISIKIIDTYADRAVTGAGTITNLISTGGGFMIDPNL
jgi:hypothetical protein